jgi:hypothetical protein
MARWTQEATAMLSDSLETLRIFETFIAFRLSLAAESDRRAATELAWDPPSSSAWNEATHVARGFGGRAEQLFNLVVNARVDPGWWREQRTLADAIGELRQLGDALLAYRARVDWVGPNSDGTATWGALDAALQRWDTAAARWGVSRSEPLGCRTG